MPTPTERVKSILENENHLAIVVGNGINRYSSPNEDKYGWDKLIDSLWQDLSSNAIPVGQDLSLTEAYDIISLCSEGESELVERVKGFVNSIEPTGYQAKLRESMMDFGFPILTTNFDKNLEIGLSKKVLRHPESPTLGFTDFYPWNVYFSNTELRNPLDGFGIWHINGSIVYPRSMHLGLTQYMNQVARARSFIHDWDRMDDNFAGKNQNRWRGYNTWLHIVFNSPLLILGLGLDVNETFFRWLLIERAKYFDVFHERRKCGWLLCLKKDMNDGKRFFLQYLGIEPIEFDDFPDLYESVLL